MAKRTPPPGAEPQPSLPTKTIAKTDGRTRERSRTISTAWQTRPRSRAGARPIVELQKRR
jgi:hypothetical protein